MTELLLADGRKFDAKTKEIVEEVQDAEPTVFLPSPPKGVRLEDLPASPKQMNAVCAIAAYELIGIDDHDIALAFGCSYEDILEIKNSDAYVSTKDQMVASFIRGQNDTARALLAGASIEAADVVVKTMRSGGKGRFKAAESVLNRVGIQDDAANSQSMSHGLTIKIIKDSGPTKVEVSIGR